MGPEQPRARRTVTAVAVVTVLLLLAGSVLLVIARTSPWPPTAWAFRGFFVLVGACSVGVGSIVAWRRSENVIGWLILAGAPASASLAVGEQVAVLAHDGRAFVGWGAWGGWIVEWAWIPPVVTLMTSLTLFPEPGRSRRRRLVLALAVLAAVPYALLEMVDRSFRNVAWYDNPVGLLDLPATVASLATVPLAVLALLAVANVVRGVRAAEGVARHQYRWVAFASTPFAVSMLLFPLLGEREVSTTHPLVLLNTVGGALLFVGIGVALTRYRLWDIDRILSRTVAYVLLTGAVAALWALVALAPAVLFGLRGADGEPNGALVGGATLLVALSFNPLRRRLQETVDRRLNRARFDATREVQALGGRLATRVDVAAVRHEVVEVLARTLSPKAVAVWTPARAEERS